MTEELLPFGFQNVNELFCPQAMKLILSIYGHNVMMYLKLQVKIYQ